MPGRVVSRKGLAQYAIYDLPWVNAIQGYYLIMMAAPDTVRLHGEEHGTVEVNPFWMFDRIEDRSVDYAVNTDSLPEMGFQTALDYTKGLRRVLRGVFLIL